MLVLKVTFRGNSVKEFAQHYLTDISPTGMFVRTQTPVAVGTKLRFEFRLENDIPLLFGQGIVLWVAEENRELNLPSGMELRFDSLTPESENHFQWLQLEKRGVTVGTEVPLYITTTTTASDPTGTVGKDSSDPTRGTPPRAEPAVGTGTLQGLKPPTGPVPDQVTRRSPTGPLPSLARKTESSTGPERAIADTAPKVRVPASEVADGRETMPYVRSGLEREPDEGLLPVLAPRPRPEQGRPAENLGPGDSDPGKMFHKRAASMSGADLEQQVGRDTLLTVQKLAARKLRLGVLAVVCVGLLALVIWWLAHEPAPNPGAGTGASAMRLVRVVSVPADAELLIEGKLAGRTPLEHRIDGEPMLQVRRSGYQPEVVKISSVDPRWRFEGKVQVLDLKVRLSRAAASPPDASAPSAEPDAAGRRRRRLPPEERPGPKRKTSPPDAPKPAPEAKPKPAEPRPEAKQPEPKPEVKPEPAKKPEPEAKPEPAKKPEAVKTPDWASRPESKQEQKKDKKKVKSPGWAD